VARSQRIDTQGFSVVVALIFDIPAFSKRGIPVTKIWSAISLLFAAALFTTIPISPQVTPRGELSVGRAQALADGPYRRADLRMYRRSYSYARRI